MRLIERLMRYFSNNITCPQCREQAVFLDRMIWATFSRRHGVLYGGVAQWTERD